MDGETTMEIDSEICGQIRPAEQHAILPPNKCHNLLGETETSDDDFITIDGEFRLPYEEFSDIMHRFDTNNHRTVKIIDVFRRLLNEIANQPLADVANISHPFARRILEFLGNGIKAAEEELCNSKTNPCMAQAEFFVDPAFYLLGFVVRLFWFIERPEDISKFIRSVVLRRNVGDVFSELFSIVLCFTNSASSNDLAAFRNSVIALSDFNTRYDFNDYFF